MIIDLINSIVFVWGLLLIDRMFHSEEDIDIIIRAQLGYHLQKDHEQ